MFAAVVAGIYNSVADAQAAMGSGIEKVYQPVAAQVEAYNALYAEYCRFGAFVG
jgi:L-ribulokinase